MEVYIYQADLWCQQCGEAICERIAAEGGAPADPGDESSYDSDEYPKGPFPDGGGESDCPQHCGAAGDCVNAVDGVGVFLENPLTADGVQYVAEAIAARSGDQAVLDEWAGFYFDEVREFNDNRTIDRRKLDKFTLAYLECALWSSTDGDGRPLDDELDISDCSQEFLRQAIDDCREFQHENAELLEAIDSEQAGHDFWLTRNHHGAGFWDRGLGEDGQKLTEASHTYGSCDLYIGDDGEVYSS